MSQKHNLTAFVYDKRGRLLSVGRNSYVRTHPIQAKAAKAVGQTDRVFLHAEVAALVKLKDWTKAHRIFVTRVDRNGVYQLAKPCACCMHVIKQTSIKVIEHT